MYKNYKISGTSHQCVKADQKRFETFDINSNKLRYNYIIQNKRYTNK